MKTKIFSLHDGKAQMFQTPFFMPTLGMALRAFTDLCNEADTMVSRHPEDYCLYEIGEYDDADASFSPLIPIKLVGTAQEFKKLRQDKPRPEYIDMSKVMSEQAKEVINSREQVA